VAGERVTVRRYLVRGLVQGVGFRFFVRETAVRLGVCGYVRNLANGDVEVHAEAPASVLASLRTELKRGPMMSSVSEVIEQDIEVPSLHSSFYVKGM
jgi:acylphosphatase